MSRQGVHSLSTVEALSPNPSKCQADVRTAKITLEGSF